MSRAIVRALSISVARHARHCRGAKHGRLLVADISCHGCRTIVDMPVITCWRWADRPALVQHLDDLPARAAKVDVRFLQLLAGEQNDRLPEDPALRQRWAAQGLALLYAAAGLCERDGTPNCAWTVAEVLVRLGVSAALRAVLERGVRGG
jgi:hypothetical protein